MEVYYFLCLPRKKVSYFKKHYQQELQNIRSLAKEFADLHPAIASMLSGQSTDPDVERLLEGTAFLTGLLKQKLDDSLPEIIHLLTELVYPHFLRSVPALTLIQFTPKSGLQETIKIPGNTSLRSDKIKGTSCSFRTCSSCDVHPLRIVKAQVDQASQHGHAITLHVDITGGSLATWNPTSLSLFLGGSYTVASNLFMVLCLYLRRIVLRSADGKHAHTLDASMLNLGSMKRENSLLPYPGRSFGGYRLLQEYFILPHKFLYAELLGLDRWKQRGDSRHFTITFELENLPESIATTVGKDSFLLATIPAINLFRHEAEPILLDHQLDKIRVTPAMVDNRRPEIYSVDKVIGFSRGAVKKKEYTPEIGFGDQKSGENSYTLLHSISAVHDRPEMALRFAYPADTTSLIEETLTVQLTCSDGDLSAELKQGDINRPTADTPELIDFKNLMRPTHPIDPPIAGDTLWHFLSHFSLNLFSLSDVSSLRKLLRLYIFSHGRDRGRVEANEKRINGIKTYEVRSVNRLVRGVMMRGHSLHLKIRADHFAGFGDFYLFGLVLDEFFSEYAGMNSFTQLNITNSSTGEDFAWPARIGNTPLI
ncbi:MAG: type VI secretion system baseplate subunit TssF [Candidatus Electrothrix aestuarii]|uniref:Type VI secretion system baseplate subunit TssF n=1 Tax=Candidatus Electrothrix aestuarii TaxID=3062594 RepID=A0AAU8LVM4_9BACT|nr:type VI secretion system baseplate subunit TssF [Candidatus Electrothrix aestuarii]